MVNVKQVGGHMGAAVSLVVAQLCLTLCDPVDCRRPGFPVLHCVLEFAQSHVL